MYRDFIWVKNVIESCEKIWHLQAAYKVLDLFERKHGPNAHHGELVEKLIDKQKSINNAILNKQIT